MQLLATLACVPSIDGALCSLPTIRAIRYQESRYHQYQYAASNHASQPHYNHNLLYHAQEHSFQATSLLNKAAVHKTVQ